MYVWCYILWVISITNVPHIDVPLALSIIWKAKYTSFVSPFTIIVLFIAGRRKINFPIVAASDDSWINKAKQTYFLFLCSSFVCFFPSFLHWLIDWLIDGTSYCKNWRADFETADAVTWFEQGVASAIKTNQPQPKMCCLWGWVSVLFHLNQLEIWQEYLCHWQCGYTFILIYFTAWHWEEKRHCCIVYYSESN